MTFTCPIPKLLNVETIILIYTIVDPNKKKQIKPLAVFSTLPHLPYQNKLEIITNEETGSNLFIIMIIMY